MITQKYDSLSYSEKLFCDFIVHNRDEAVNMAIAELAAKLGIAQSTIVATTKELGFSGWREFRLSLAAEVVNPVKYWESGEEENSEKTYRRIISSNIKILKEVETIPLESFEKAVDYIMNAKKIVILGIGTSNVLASEAFDYFLRLGLPVEFFSDWHHQQLSVMHLDSDSLAVFISQTGVNREINSLSAKAREKGCPMIGISNYRNTSFSKFMDVLLAPLSNPSKDHDNHFALRIPIIGIIEILYYMVSERLGEKYQTELAINWSVANSSIK